MAHILFNGMFTRSPCWRYHHALFPNWHVSIADLLISKNKIFEPTSQLATVSMWFLFAYLSYWDVKTWSGQSLQYSASLWTFKWRLQAKFIRLLHSQLPTQALILYILYLCLCGSFKWRNAKFIKLACLRQLTHIFCRDLELWAMGHYRRRAWFITSAALGRRDSLRDGSENCHEIARRFYSKFPNPPVRGDRREGWTDADRRWLKLVFFEEPAKQCISWPLNKSHPDMGNGFLKMETVSS